ncbi:MAG TPA: hypothetical protein VIA10_04380 [Gaiellaceae bacterium]|jgi:hypothetical protein
MRTTLTIDDDVAVRLERLRRDGRTLKEVVNEALRAGLDALEETKARPREQYTTPMDLGAPLVPVDDISAVLDLLDEEEWRRKLR